MSVIPDHEIDQDDGIKSNPVFGKPLPRGDIWPDIFVLMPFDDPFNTIYEDHILKVIQELNLDCKRADDFFSTQAIILDIWSAIYYSRICIADCTDRNPNVFYELGIAHTLGRPTVLITQSMDDIPFDVKHRRVIPYTYNPRGMQEFEVSLNKTLLHELQPFLGNIHADKLLPQATSKFLGGVPTSRTRAHYEKRIQGFLNWRAHQKPAPLSAQIAMYVDYLMDMGFAPVSVRSHFGSLKGLVKSLATIDISFAADLIKLDEIKLPAYPPKKEKNRLSDQQLQELLSLPDTNTRKGLRDACMLHLITEIGFSASEVTNLRWSSLTQSGTSYMLERDTISVELSPVLSGLLSRWYKISMSGTNLYSPVFCRIARHGHIVRGESGITLSAINKVLREYAALMGFPSMSFRTLLA